MIKNATTNEGEKMNESTKKFVADIAETYNGDKEKTAQWIRKSIRCSISEARALVAQAA